MSLDIRRDEVQRLMRRLYQLVPANGNFTKQVELKSMFSELTFNIIMRMIAGKRYFGGEVSGNEEEGRRFREIIKELFELAVSSYISWELPANIATC